MSKVIKLHKHKNKLQVEWMIKGIWNDQKMQNENVRNVTKKEGNVGLHLFITNYHRMFSESPKRFLTHNNTLLLATSFNLHTHMYWPSYKLSLAHYHKSTKVSLLCFMGQILV
jgi:hypothetical protein